MRITQLTFALYAVLSPYLIASETIALNIIGNPQKPRIILGNNIALI